MTTASTGNESAVPTLTILLTGNAPRSLRARTNLAAALKTLGRESVKPLEIDLLAQPGKTVTYSIFATPALLRVNNDGETSILYGDLSDEDKLLAFLKGIE